MGKLIIISAPSGAGKSTIIQHLLTLDYDFTFSISATSRSPRGNEQHGKEYYFLSPKEFKQKIENNDFIEYEEVYPDCFYGTLKSEIDRAHNTGKTLLFDVDVKGGINIKRLYKEQALSIFIQPPSVEELRKRLINRNTDTTEMINKRVAKATEEITYASQFDIQVINDRIEIAQQEVAEAIRQFLAQK